MDFLQSLASSLDRPGIPWKNILVSFYLTQYVFEGILALRQYKVLQRTKPPKSLEGHVSQEVFDKSQAYGRAKAQFKFISGLYDLAQSLIFIYGNVFPKIWALAGGWIERYAPNRFSGELSHSVLAFILFTYLNALLSIPTGYYSNFVVEEKFGFNKQTPKLFFTDIIKTQALVTALGGPALAGVLAIIQRTGTHFFYYVWFFLVALSLFMITIYPIVILPVFNKLSPLQEGPLKDGVEALAKRLNFPLSNLFVIDGSKRSAHSNAYFFGLPWKKHIVIYDTLIEKSETEEIVAVLSHELGHWHYSHTIKLFGISQFHTFYMFALFSIFIQNRSFYEDLGFHNEMPVLIGLLLFGIALAPMDILVNLAMNVLSRKFEFEADAFATKLGYSAELASSLIKLQIQNLSTIDADWLFATYHYSHPILPERLAAMGFYGDKKADGAKDGVVKAADREL